jgi:hypothetical protein
MVNPARPPLRIEHRVGGQQASRGQEGKRPAQLSRNHQRRPDGRQDPQHRPGEAGQCLGLGLRDEQLEEPHHRRDAAIDQARPVHVDAFGRLQAHEVLVPPAGFAVGQGADEDQPQRIVGVAERRVQLAPGPEQHGPVDDGAGGQGEPGDRPGPPGGLCRLRVHASPVRRHDGDTINTSDVEVYAP